MSGVSGVSSAAFQAVQSAWEEAAPTKTKKTKKAAKGAVTVGGSVKRGKASSSVSVKVDNDGDISATVGHGVTIPIGDARVKLGAKYTRKTDVNRLIQWFFWLFGRRQGAAGT